MPHDRAIARTDSDSPLRRHQCRHIFTDGHRCGSPCLRDQHFCYYHNRARSQRPVASPYDAFLAPNQTTFALDTPEDSSAIQYNIGEIIRQLAANALDPRRAGLLLYALQIASQNLKTSRPKAPAEPKPTVEEVIDDPLLGLLAPETSYEDPANKLTGSAREILRWVQEVERDREDTSPKPLPTTLDLQASRHTTSRRKPLLH